MSQSLNIEIYQAEAIPEHFRKGEEDVNGGIQPLCQPLIETPSLFELLHLLLKDGQNLSRIVAAVQSDCKWMREEVSFRTFLVRLEGSVECGSEI